VWERGEPPRGRLGWAVTSPASKKGVDAGSEGADVIDAGTSPDLAQTLGTPVALVSV
jgi:hypothetical protein